MDGNGEVQHGLKVAITITLVQTPQGKSVHVQANPPEALCDHFMCYMMLEGARDAIKDFHDKQAAANQQRIQAVLEMPPNLRR